jgi:hypothetical protein
LFIASGSQWQALALVAKRSGKATAKALLRVKGKGVAAACIPWVGVYLLFFAPCNFAPLLTQAVAWRLASRFG